MGDINYPRKNTLKNRYLFRGNYGVIVCYFFWDSLLWEGFFHGLFSLCLFWYLHSQLIGRH